MNLNLITKAASINCRATPNISFNINLNSNERIVKNYFLNKIKKLEFLITNIFYSKFHLYLISAFGFKFLSKS